VPAHEERWIQRSSGWQGPKRGAGQAREAKALDTLRVDKLPQVVNCLEEGLRGRGVRFRALTWRIWTLKATGLVRLAVAPVESGRGTTIQQCAKGAE